MRTLPSPSVSRGCSTLVQSANHPRARPQPLQPRSQIEQRRSDVFAGAEKSPLSTSSSSPPASSSSSSSPSTSSPSPPPPSSSPSRSRRGSLSTSSSSSSASAPSAPSSPSPSPSSSWTATDGERSEDFLTALGTRQQYNINVDHGQNVDHLDSLFTGSVLGHRSDIADGSLREDDHRRTFNNLVGDYYVAPSFMEAVALHVTKNALAETNVFDDKTNVPLILGIWGGKGQGKTFQVELTLKKLGAEVVTMSAGEMEDEWAGVPGQRIRQRYKAAAELGRVRGRLSALVINDLDAGVGVFANTQRTVNNQIVIGTLMALCDDPNYVEVVADDWRTGKPKRVPRTPIIVTGNDLSTLFAPLLRDGRMDKFYWQPTREDLTNIVWQMYKEDGLTKEDVGVVLDAFPNQSLDFYGAMRGAVYDAQIRQWITDTVGFSASAVNDSEGDGDDASDDGGKEEDKKKRGERNMAELSRRLVLKEGLPSFGALELELDDLLAEGRRLQQEQEHVMTQNLAREYLKNSDGGGGLLGLQGDYVGEE